MQLLEEDRVVVAGVGGANGLCHALPERDVRRESLQRMWWSLLLQGVLFYENHPARAKYGCLTDLSAA